jgi:outer membrane receptor protein involved in Fe transport
MVDGQDRFAAQRVESQTGGFTTGDIRTYLRLRPGVLLTAGVTNFGDRLVLEHFDYKIANGGVARDGKPFSSSFQPGANYYVGAELTY